MVAILLGMLLALSCGEDTSADGRLQNFLFDPTPIGPVQNVQVIQDGTAAVLTWRALDEADIYLVYIAENQNNNFYRRSEQFSSNAARLNDLPLDIALFFYVVPVNSEGSSGPPSAVVSITLSGN